MAMSRLKPFDPNTLPDNFLVVFYGMRRCGKSTTLEYMLYELRDRLKDHEVWLFSSTAKVSRAQYRYVPPDFRISDLAHLNEDLQDIMSEMEELYGDVGEDEQDDEKENGKKVLIIMDDCVGEDTVRHCPMLKRIAVAGRHVNISLIMLSQGVTGSTSVPLSVRQQTDSAIICTLPRSVNERKLLLTESLTVQSGAPALKATQELLEEVTSVKHRCLVVDRSNTAARRVSEYLFTYGPVPYNKSKDEPIPPVKAMKLGKKQQWGEEDEAEGKQLEIPDPTQAEEGNEGKLDDEEEHGVHDMHGGTAERARGTQFTAPQQRLQLERSLQPNLPPSLGGKGRSGEEEGKGVEMRSFVRYGFTGGSATGSAEVREQTEDGSFEEVLVQFLAGWTEDKPTGKRKRELKNMLQTLKGRKIGKFQNLRVPKASRQGKK